MNRIVAIAIGTAIVATVACASFGTTGTATDDGGTASGEGGPISDAAADDAPIPPTKGDGGHDAGATQVCNGALDCERLVFTTSKSFPAVLGGLAGADAKCKMAADASKVNQLHGRQWVAWLSTMLTDAKNRLMPSMKAYVRTDGTPIATSFAKLVGGNIDQEISYDENGSPASGAVWSATGGNGERTTGTSGTLGTCGDWTTTPGATAAGDATRKDERWTTDSAPNCTSQARLYCFEF